MTSSSLNSIPAKITPAMQRFCETIVFSKPAKRRIPAHAEAALAIYDTRRDILVRLESSLESQRLLLMKEWREAWRAGVDAGFLAKELREMTEELAGLNGTGKGRPR